MIQTCQFVPLVIKSNISRKDGLLIERLQDLPMVVISGEPGAGKSTMIEELPFVEELHKLPTRPARKNEVRDNEPVSWRELIDMAVVRAEGNPLPADQSVLDWDILAKNFGITTPNLEDLAVVCPEHLTIYDFKMLYDTARKTIKRRKLPVIQASPLHQDFFLDFFKNVVVFRLLTHPETRVKRLVKRYGKQAEPTKNSRLLLTLTAAATMSDDRVIELWNDTMEQKENNLATISGIVKERFPDIR